MRSIFNKVAMGEKNPKWENSITRLNDLYKRSDDIRNEFMRDYNRILHCTAYRRLKHKTQVFFATENDHICTRIEHVNHVASVSYSLSHFLGLNTQLTNAIALGHDLGHAPFGHSGEEIISGIVEEELGEKFWHEKNSLRFVDKLETLQDDRAWEHNLNLTYAVRDGIISHCGEVDDNVITPREEFLDLGELREPSQYSPYTWEGCIVKIADKIAFIGRDMEDALELDVLSVDDLWALKKDIKTTLGIKVKSINNTALMHGFMIDLCDSSDPEEGIRISSDSLKLMKHLREFSYKNIYHHERLSYFQEYAELIIRSIYKALKGFYEKENTLANLKRYQHIYPLLIKEFTRWIIKYSSLEGMSRPREYKNSLVYDIKDEKDYRRSIIDFISGMTDNFAIKLFKELTTFL